ncbi:cupin domain-containing protein [Pusillimonas sp. CC-YST705]|uniref:Cupin domain-containing protein n=1 Tax=Mesopusillimonas faecipullorum TaxID=2755040 RepID=A0ABS8C8B5_9BURK|nr:cupin domain-containing protein [Mesopusillimonas faecipullorum]MCB5362265.1 cupin domain-containing protein [Mesopusillimonas faecipullorum]
MNSPQDKLSQPLTLLGGISPQRFMREYWQRKPLLIRQAIPGFRPALSIQDIRQLVKREEVESRLIWRDEQGWNMKQGPFQRLPAMKRPDWTVLAQSVDLHDDRMAELLHRFRFIGDARLDDAMISIASDGGGVGPHFDSYDVFLLQAHGKREWRISQQSDLSLTPGLPLKILKNFQAEDTYVLEPGDMLYLPPHVAHDGIARGDCMTISIGFRTAGRATLAHGLLEAAADQVMARAGEAGGLYGHPVLPGARLEGNYHDRGQRPTATPARIPDQLIGFALDAVNKVRFDEALASRFLGMWLTNPPEAAWFDPPDDPLDLVEYWPLPGRLVLDRCTRMMYSGKALYINGEVASIAAGAAMCSLADERALDCSDASVRRLPIAAREALNDWLEQGWLHYLAPDKD